MDWLYEKWFRWCINHPNKATATVIIINLAFYGGLIYSIIHFIVKYW